MKQYQRTNLSTRALKFLLVLHDADACQEESIGTLRVSRRTTLRGHGGRHYHRRPRGLHSKGSCFPACNLRRSAHSLTARLLRPISEPALRRCVRTELSSALTLRLTPVLMLVGVVCTSTLGSARCNRLPYLAATGNLLAPSSWR